VRQGQDPMAVIRDPNHPMIDTKLSESIRGPEVVGRPIGLAAATTASAA
jgi:hypothetical protein